MSNHTRVDFNMMFNKLMNKDKPEVKRQKRTAAEKLKRRLYQVEYRAGKRRRKK